MPEGGQWWGKTDDSGERVFFIGRDPSGQLVYMNHPDGAYESEELDLSGWVHLENCTDWDWVQDEAANQAIHGGVYKNLQTIDEIIDKFPCPEGYEYQRTCPGRPGIDELNFYDPEEGGIYGWIPFQSVFPWTIGEWTTDGKQMSLLRCKTDDRPVVEQAVE